MEDRYRKHLRQTQKHKELSPIVAHSSKKDLIALFEESPHWAVAEELHSHPAIKYVWKSVSSDRLWLHFASLLNIQINAYVNSAIITSRFFFLSYDGSGHNP